VTPEPFLSAQKNVGDEFLYGVKNFHRGKVLFEQAAYDFLYLSNSMS
jgi:hypothetical protein